MCEQIGTGTFGTVHRCTFKGYDAALKQLTTIGTENEKVLSAFQKEVKIMCALSHPCTIRIYAWVKRPLAMVMELAVCDLRDFYLSKANGACGGGGGG